MAIEHLSTNLKNRREEIGITQVLLSQKSGVSRRVINELEKGSGCNATMITLDKLSKSLNCGIEELFKNPKEENIK